MSKRNRILVGTVLVGATATGLFLWSRNAAAHDEGPTTVAVERGTIIDKALAVGQIVPDQEIQVKSQISGIVSRMYVDVGDRVEIGQPLFTITPDPTPLELADAERAVESAQVAYDKAQQDLERHHSLWSDGILAKDSFDGRQKDFEQARISLEQAKDKLALLKEGRIERRQGRASVDSIIRASAAGTILERRVNPGDPVVPLTTFQEGTVVMTLADMGTLEFRGTVDEIDVGKLHDGLPARIQVGALPGDPVGGALSKIAPKAREKEGATVFDVEVAIDTTSTDAYLRAGYSANADIIVEEKTGVLLLPERVVTIDGDSATVRLPAATPDAEPEERTIRIGLSDGLNIEVLEGLDEGDQVLQPVAKKIE